MIFPCFFPSFAEHSNPLSASEKQLKKSFLWSLGTKWNCDATVNDSREKKAALRRLLPSTVIRHSSEGGEGNLSVTKLDNAQENCKNIQNVNLKMEQWVLLIFSSRIFLLSFLFETFLLKLHSFFVLIKRKRFCSPLRACNSTNF